jgi:hypothetical protein
MPAGNVPNTFAALAPDPSALTGLPDLAHQDLNRRLHSEAVHIYGFRRPFNTLRLNSG